MYSLFRETQLVEPLLKLSLHSVSKCLEEMRQEGNIGLRGEKESPVSLLLLLIYIFYVKMSLP